MPKSLVEDKVKSFAQKSPSHPMIFLFYGKAISCMILSPPVLKLHEPIGR